MEYNETISLWYNIIYFDYRSNSMDHDQHCFIIALDDISCNLCLETRSYDSEKNVRYVFHIIMVHAKQTNYHYLSLCGIIYVYNKYL